MLQNCSAGEAVCNPQHAQWVINVLGLLIAVVGKQTLLGVILRQTRAEIASVIPPVSPPCKGGETGGGDSDDADVEEPAPVGIVYRPPQNGFISSN